jgi:hypothetical protein
VVLLCNLCGWVTDGSKHPGEGLRAASFFFCSPRNHGMYTPLKG